ncbi:methylmalonyl-CoA mutase family protein [Gordonia sp. VNK21]|uniref:methylmalonyl-CoA mutase family protein n=1 Tax=Gordonia sp. VNK21 TaxID=3382483 RepID=UPI0038D38C21
MTEQSERSDNELAEDYQRWSTAAAEVLAKARRVTPDELGDTPENLLATHTRDGVTVRPLYTRKDERAENGLPGSFPFVRGADPARDVNLGWRVTERFGDDPGQSAAEVNEALLDAAGSGTSGLWLRVGGALAPADLGRVLAGVYLDLLPVTLDAGSAGIEAARAYLEFRAGAPAAPQAAEATAGTVHSLGLSPYTAAYSGRPSVPVAEATGLAADLPAGVRTFRVDGTDFAQSGASNSQELGLLVSAGLAHVRDLVAAGLTPAAALRQITFAVSVDDDQFAGIAKLRALRAMWSRVAEVLGGPEAGAAITHAVTDLAMLTQRDPWVNMLRSTIAAFGAGVGGADQVTVLGFDASLPADARTTKSTFSRRIARNTQLLLLEESNIGRVLDPAGGSWYVESLTDDLAAAGWELFTRLDAAGGYQAALDDGIVAAEIEAALNVRDDDVAHRRQAVTGVSEFPNLGEPTLTGTAGTVEVATAAPNLARVARRFEALRDRADAVTADAGARPSILLLPLGSVAEHNGRTTFVTNLLAAGGIAAVNPGPVDADGVAALVAEHPGSIAVLCGTKARYQEDGPGVAAAARAAGIDHLLLAGPEREWPDGPSPAGSPPDGSLKAGIDAVTVLTELLDRLTGAATTVGA